MKIWQYEEGCKDPYAEDYAIAALSYNIDQLQEAVEKQRYQEGDVWAEYFWLQILYAHEHLVHHCLKDKRGNTVNDVKKWLKDRENEGLVFNH